VAGGGRRQHNILIPQFSAAILLGPIPGGFFEGGREEAVAVKAGIFLFL
jgi:hypothetical protein